MICVYENNCKDFATHGLGAVSPLSCQTTEQLNGEWELTLVHPIDQEGKWKRLTEGRILIAPVPGGTVPQVQKQQPFRIYRVVPDLQKVTVYARHIFYDLIDNMVRKVAPGSTTPCADVVQAVSTGCLTSHSFICHSDMTSTAEGFQIENKNPVDALLGSDGVIARYGGELARDWWNVYLLNRVGSDTAVTIRAGKNLKGISYDVDLSDVSTRIMPTGEDAEGNVLYLPELFIDSPNIGAYSQPKWLHLPVSGAKVVDGQKTANDVYEDLRNIVRKKFEAGCDVPKVTVTVDFISCENTVEYADMHHLQEVFLGDEVAVVAPRIGVAVRLRVIQYSYDCLLKRYTSVTLGSVSDTVADSLITGNQLASGSIKSGHIAMNSIGSGQLQAGAVGEQHIQAGSITTSLIASDFGETLDLSSNTGINLRVSKIYGDMEDGLSGLHQADAGLELRITETESTIGNVQAAIANLGVSIDENMANLDLRVTETESGTTALWDAIAALTVTVGDTTTGLLARVTNAEADILAGTELYIKEADLEAKIGVYKMADGLTMAQMQADLVSLRANLTAEIQAQLVKIAGALQVESEGLSPSITTSKGIYCGGAVNGNRLVCRSGVLVMGSGNDEYKAANITSWGKTVLAVA